MSSRYPIVTRYTTVEREMVRMLCEFYSLNERQAQKFAVMQLFDVTKKLNDKIQKEKGNEQANSSPDAGVGADSSGPDTVATPSEPADSADTAGQDTASSPTA